MLMMDNELTDTFFKFNENCLEYIRREYNLTDPDVRKEAIQLLQEWIQKQEHFLKKDFDPNYLEKLLIMAKGSVESAKKNLDKMCTTKTLLPQYFDKLITKSDCEIIHKSISCVILPKQIGYRRVYLLKGENFDIFSPTNFDNFVRLNITLMEMAFFYDYFLGCYLVLDISGIDPMDILTKMGINNLRNLAAVFVEGYQVRIKGVYFISPSKLIDSLVSVVKQIISKKIAERVMTCKNYEELYEHLPREIFPEDCGGEEKSTYQLREILIDRLTGEEHTNNMKKMNRASTDESCRRVDKFNEEYAGMPGTFRQLKVD